jgi:predicted Zn-dependent protease
MEGLRTGLMSDSDFIDSILASIDPESFVKSLGFHTDKTRVLGKSIKTPCMVHKDSAFASLIIDVDKKTFKCMKAGCRANEGGNLVELYSLYTGKTLNNAALSLAEALNISVDDSAVDELFENLRDKATIALNEHNWADLALAIESIESIRAHHNELNYWKALVHENNPASSKDEVMALWRRALKDLVPVNGFLSLSILETRLLSETPESEELLLLKADLHDHNDQKLEEQETLTQLIRLKQDHLKNLDERLFDRLSEETLRNEPDLYLIWGAICEANELPSKAVEYYLLAEQYFRFLEERVEALEALIKASLLAPEQSELAKRAYDELVFEGAPERATEFLRTCVEKMLALGKCEQALPLCKKLLIEQPGEMANWDLALHLYDALGDSSGKAEALLAKCELHQADGSLSDDHLEALQQVCSAFPDKEHLLRLSEVFYSASKTDTAFQFLEQALLESSKVDSDAVQLALIRKVLEKFPPNQKLQRRYLELLKSTGAAKEWQSEALRLIHEQNNEPSIFDSVMEELESSAPQDLNVKFLRIERLIKAGSQQKVLQQMALSILDQTSKMEGRELAAKLMKLVDSTSAYSHELHENYVVYLSSVNTQEVELTASEAQFILKSSRATPSLYVEVFQSSNVTMEDKKLALCKAAQEVLRPEWSELRESVYQQLSTLKPTEDVLVLQLDLAESLNKLADVATLLTQLSELPTTLQDQAKIKRYLEKRVQLFPEDLKALEELAELHHQAGNLNAATNLLIQQAEILEQKGETEKASQILSVCRAKAPDNLLVQRKLVSLLLESGNRKQALQSLEQIALQLQETGLEKEALSTWKELLSYDSTNQVAKNGFLRVALNCGTLKPADAQLLLELLINNTFTLSVTERVGLSKKLMETGVGVIELLPLLKQDLQEHPTAFGSSDRLILFGFARGLHDLDFAWELVRAVPISMLPAIPDLEFVYDQAYTRDEQQKADEALSRWVQLLHQKGNHEEVAYLLKSILAEHPTKLIVRQLYSQVLELDPKDQEEFIQFQLNTAELAFEQHQHLVVKEVLDQLQNRFGKDAFVLEQCANFQLKLGNPAKAEELLSASIDCHLNEERRELALELLDSLLGITKNPKPVLRRKADLLRDLDRFELAVEIYLSLLAEDTTPAGQLDLLKRILELHPKRNDSRLQYARLLGEAGQLQASVDQFLKLHQATKDTDLEQARGYMDEALLLAPENPKIRAIRFQDSLENGLLVQAISHGQFLITYYKAQGLFEEAVQLVEKLKERFSEDQEDILRLETQLEGTNPTGIPQKSPRVRLAKKLAKEGRVMEAIEELEMALLESSTSLDVQRALVPLYLKSNQFEKAQQQYLKIIDTLLNEGSIDEATLVVDQLFHLDSQNVPLREQVATLFVKNSIPEVASDQYLWIATHYQEEKHLREALKWCQKALECTPRSIDGRIQLGTLYERLNQPNEATAQYLKAAELLVENGSLEKAAQYVEQICRLTPESAEPREQLVKLYEQIGQRTRMGDQLDKLANIYSKQHRTQEHVRILKRMVTLNPDHTQHRTNLISALKQSGNKEELYQFLMLQGDLYLKKGKTENAIKIFGEALLYAKDRTGAVAQILDQIRQYGTPEQFVEYGLQQVEIDLSEGNIPEAQKLLYLISTSAQKNAGYYLAMAALFEATSQEKQAADALKRAEQLAEESATPEQKIALYKKLIDVSPNNFNAWRLIIRAYRAQNRLEESQLAQQELAFRYASKEMHQEAVTELRVLLQLDPENTKAWEQLFESYKTYAPEKELLEEYLTYGGILTEKSQFLKALETISKVINWDPHNLEARLAYVRAFLKIGKEEDLVEDYLTIADLLVSKNRLDDALHYFNKVTAIDPNYKNAEARATQTQRLKRTQAKQGPPLVEPNQKRPHEAPAFKNRTEHPTETQIRYIKDTKTNSAHQFLMDEMDALDKEDELEELRQIVQNYQDILTINPQNANVKVKLANLHLQLNEKEKALKELVEARDLYFNKGEIATCIEVCEKILELNPTDQRTRLQLKQTINKRDAFKALESAIIFSDTNDESKH